MSLLAKKKTTTLFLFVQAQPNNSEHSSAGANSVQVGQGKEGPAAPESQAASELCDLFQVSIVIFYVSAQVKMYISREQDFVL